MSRIQDILAKAERDGTTGRLAPLAAPAPARAVSFDGTSALNPSYELPVETVAEPRTAVPTLHPALVAAIAPHSAPAEQYRAVRARLAQRDDQGQLRSIVVTSPAAGDGKSITAANLALTMAQELQHNVLLIDADLRGSAVHELFGFERGPGLADVLTGAASLEDALVHLSEHRLTLLPAGETPAYPAEMLGSAGMRKLLDTLRHRFDRIILDAPAVASLSDSATLATVADGVLMVVRAGISKRPALDEALTAFDSDKVVGVVLNESH